MPEAATRKRAEKDKEAGKSASTQAGNYVKEEMDHIRQGKHGARSPKQAIAIGLSKARRAGVDLPPPKKGNASEATRKKAQQDTAKGKSAKSKPSAKRSKATTTALQREPRSSASKSALSKHAKQAAAARRKRGKVTSSGRTSRAKK